MQNITLVYNGKHYKRISKKSAEKAFHANTEIVICPVKLWPFGPMNFGLSFGKAAFVGDYSFQDFVNNFKWNNCSYETGYYSAFYIEVKGE